PSEIGSAATLNDISTWARNRPIIGVHDARGCSASTWSGVVVSLMGLADLRAVGQGGEQVQAERAGEERAGSLTTHTGAGTVQGRGERPEGALARGHGDDAAGDPRLRRHPDLEEPFPGALVHPAGGEHGQGVPAHL